ncbi:hypothetical protein SVA_2704 [Sulfurifustis variabilis]|uniref:Asparagine synthase n=1 Tax=Sulfurifustis variabilis TaxID=1675686 RepID=A0A1B4V9C1_9GAMM|nr:hypothetical protein [Sulfurifustis variabilis]BAU49252.1 hypothetical protein SVA_2704 [Sulfurifustis variabilis]
MTGTERWQSLVSPETPRACAHAHSSEPGFPYVAQFLLGPRFVEHLAQWRRKRVAGRFSLTLHPSLACTQVADAGRELTLIGHILDPRRPEAGNAEILQALLSRFRTREDLVDATTGYGGRWLLIAARGQESFLFHDALGLRQVFYTDPASTGELWAVSQPGIAAEALALAPDEQALDYMDTETYRRTNEYRWPGTASTFTGLRHLPPNHRLDLATGASHRYWPSKPLDTFTLDAAVERLLALVPGLVRAATARFDVALSLTAGVDSRFVLAAARDLVDRLRFVTVRQGRLPDGHPDVEIPARLLARLGLPHDVISATSTMSPEFSLRFKRNVYRAHDHYGHDAEAILDYYGRTRAVLTGSGAEVGRRPFRTKLPHADRVRLTPETLAWLEYGSTHPFLVKHFAEWLDGARGQEHVKLLDLFEWEQDYGNWLAQTQLEFDVAWREIVTPYNCRAVLATLLGTPERYRGPDALLWREFIRRAWPELLAEPINPHKRTGRFGRTVADAKAIAHYWSFRRRCARPAEA